jgi:hypothetical protein
MRDTPLAGTEGPRPNAYGVPVRHYRSHMLAVHGVEVE